MTYELLEAAKIIVKNKIGSTSLLQRRLSIGYLQAVKLMRQLEDAGVVGPKMGSWPRKVLIENEEGIREKILGVTVKEN